MPWHGREPMPWNGTRTMSLLILLSIPALSALLCMIAAITDLTLYPRLQKNPCRVIPFPVNRDRRPPTGGTRTVA